ncbi:hypothetical protein [Streptomyces swartbergensis]|uniref:hypothetical protein n=1 Tax=Streptomyces swartbergensis TaxID=487165 RepID=UPI003823DA46
MNAVATPAGRVVGRRAVLGATAFAAVVEFLPAAPTVLLTLSGLWLLLGAPAVLWYGIASRVVSTRDGRVLLAVGLSVLTDIAVALAVNSALPLFGVAQPLSRPALAAGSALAVLVLAVVADPPAEHRGGLAWWREVRADGAPPGAVAVSVLGGVALVLSIAGAIRLNNRLGSSVSVAALVCVATLLVLLMARCRRYPPSVIGLGLFLAAAGLLLLTSLRGWYITGHDIQREYEVFRLTADAGRWNIAVFRDPYNACLSITLLPTSLVRLTGISGTSVFKVILPLLFALAPVLVHRSVRNVAPQLVAVLSAVIFMAFPTFFTDMTFLARQEVAFVLLGCAVLVLTDSGRPLRNRRITFLALTTGIVLAHYSTVYIVVAVLGLAFGVDLGWRVLSRLRRADRRTAVPRAFVSWWIVASMAAAAVVWAGPVTNTTGQLRTTLVTSVQELVDDGHAKKSWASEVSYSLLGGERFSPERQLRDYRAETVDQTAEARAAGDYVPLSVADARDVPAAEERDLPLTSVGRTLQEQGLEVKAFDHVFRRSVAQLMQLFLLLGVATTIWGRRKPFHPVRDQVTLTVGTLAVIAMLTLLPRLSVDYGVLRAFQQGLFIFAPFIAAGVVWACRWAGRRPAAPLACSLVLVLFLGLTGLVPKLLGGNPPRLHLDNAGRYYDVYYSHAEERAAIGWLKSRASEDERATAQSEIPTDRFLFVELPVLGPGRALNDIYPTLIRKDAYVFLGSTTVRDGSATIFYRGDLVSYRYPVGFLDETKNKLYSSDGAEIYR